MRTFSQELVDKVIDELTSFNIRPVYLTARYSLASRAWVIRNQKHVFEFIDFRGSEELEKWCRKIEPDPAGHTRYPILDKISTPAGIKAHIRTFTRIEGMEINECNLLLLPPIVEYFVSMASSLTELKLSESPTTSRASSPPY